MDLKALSIGGEMNCPCCNSENTTRFQWVDGYDFEYWICWNCDYLFIVSPHGRGKRKLETSLPNGFRVGGGR